MAHVQADWQKLIKKHCRPNHNAEGWSLGSPPDHNSDNEIIVSVETTDKKSVVKTQNTYDYGHGTLVSDYEFHLSYKKDVGIWKKFMMLMK